MPSNFRVVNAPKQTSVTTSAALIAAIHQASPGEVITLTAVVPAFALEFDGLVKPGYGVTIVLPLTQIIRVRLENRCEGLHIIGGDFSADIVNNSLSSANNGLQLSTNVTKVSVAGAYFGRNSNAVQSVSCQDVIIQACRLNASRQDQINLVTCDRFVIDGNNFEAGIKGDKFCYFSTGDNPQHNISSGSCSGQGGIWEDTAHNDVVQARNQCQDITIRNNYSATFEAQGFVSFGAATQDNWIYRVLVANNTIVDGHEFHGIWFTGTDIDVRNNTITPAEPGSPTRITIARIDSNSRVTGGNNTAPAFTNPAGVDLAATVINGDTVTPPAAPQITFPAWRPAVPVRTPSAVPVPTYAAGGGIRPATASPTVGTWLSINRGQWLGNQFVTWQYEWRRNGVAVGANQTYQIQHADADQNMTVAVRGTNAVGTGDWYEFPVFVPVQIPQSLDFTLANNSVYLTVLIDN
jgi:hypothetical protein